MSTAPLSEAELDKLSDFLFSDESPFDPADLEVIDGLFTAAISGPVKLSAGKALEVLQREKPWTSREVEQEIMGLLARHWDKIKESLADHAYTATIFEMPEDPEILGEAWALGFLELVDAYADKWKPLIDDKETGPAIRALMVLSGDIDADEAKIRDSRAELVEAIPELAQSIYDFWHKRKG